MENPAAAPDPPVCITAATVLASRKMARSADTVTSPAVAVTKDETISAETLPSSALTLSVALAAILVVLPNMSVASVESIS